SSGGVFALLEDRERNIWVGTNTGLDRFTRSNIVRDPTLPCSEGGFATVRGAFVAGEGGSLWIACPESAARARVAEFRDGVIVNQQNAPPFGVAYRDLRGTIWFAGPTALGHVENGRLVTMPLPAHVGGRRVQALLREESGALWVSVIGKGVFRFFAGEWSDYGNLDALPRAPAYVETMDGRGDLWFGYTESRVARV